MAAQHRLILSGTPIQNSVLELWALFDFLMPGFLGGQAAFHAKFGKAVAASRGASLGSAEAQAGLLAMDGLHKQARLPLVDPALSLSIPSLLATLAPRLVICSQASLFMHLFALHAHA